jgi:hypothetical protein
MAKKYYKAPVHQTGSIVTTKTQFGSTSDMIVDHSVYTVDGNPVTIHDSEIVCKDDRGFYITSKNRINSAINDTNELISSGNSILQSGTTFGQNVSSQINGPVDFIKKNKSFVTAVATRINVIFIEKLFENVHLLPLVVTIKFFSASLF